MTIDEALYNIKQGHGIPHKHDTLTTIIEYVKRIDSCKDVISRKHLLLEIDNLMKSPWFNRYKDDCGALHFGYIERKEAVEIVRDSCVKTEPPVQPKVVPIAEIRFDDDKLHEIVDEAVKNIEIKYKWIPVSKPPKEVGNYLTSIRHYGEERFVQLSFFDGTSFKAEVEAWMPLPEPYKTESEGEE